jgi:hypothetical protein
MAEIEGRPARVDSRETLTLRAEMHAGFDEMERSFELLREERRAMVRRLLAGLSDLGDRMDRGVAELREMVAADRRSLEAAYPEIWREIALPGDRS